MGCGSSSMNEQIVSPAIPTPLPVISAPQGGLQMVPTPQRDQHGRPLQHRDFDINRSQILQAFHHMAEYLRSQGSNITIITVGGVVNTVFLRTRATTHDVDFFGSNEHHRLLRDASKFAQRRSQSQLGASWLNNTTTLFTAQTVQSQLAQEAVRQDAIIFREQGLTVLAAPWMYCLCGKIDRISKGNARPYDISDAIVYLHEHIRLHHGPVQGSAVQQASRRFNLQCSQRAVMAIANAYHQQYRTVGISI